GRGGRNGLAAGGGAGDERGNENGESGDNGEEDEKKQPLRGSSTPFRRGSKKRGRGAIGGVRRGVGRSVRPRQSNNRISTSNNINNNVPTNTNATSNDGNNESNAKTSSASSRRAAAAAAASAAASGRAKHDSEIERNETADEDTDGLLRDGEGGLDEQKLYEIPLEPLDLVWAKCRGYPWYPALIIDPDAATNDQGDTADSVLLLRPRDRDRQREREPRDGSHRPGGGGAQSNQSQPQLLQPSSGAQQGGTQQLPQQQQQQQQNQLFLVLFFDAKRTWQWLPRSKLVPLGPDADTDKKKLQASRKPAERKAVKKAFEEAIAHRCRVARATGEDPIS
ncbi:bromodomain and PHD finger-containing protein 1, partial [Tropilaelaps mercedesae]